MSLNVYLYHPTIPSTGSGIFIRENGENREISQAEWDERFPGAEPIRPVLDDDYEGPVYSANITHNLGKMAAEAGVYEALWRPEEINATHASDLLAALRRGLDNLIENPDHFKAFNPSNGWGDYNGLVSFVTRYLEACEMYPDAEVSVSR